MIVCQCEVVTDRQVVGAITEGAETLGQLCRLTRAGTGCGRCVPTLKALMCEACPLAVTHEPEREIARATR